MTQYTATTRDFTAKEWAYALGGAFLVQGVFLGLLVFFGDSRGASQPEHVEAPLEIPIAVQPVLDELPLLKLGSKKQLKPKLPDMWKKRDPAPVKRYEERSAPSEQAKDDPEEIPESEIADKEHEAPPEDAEIVKEVEQDIEDPEEEPTPLDEEGAEDGVEEGTETDPLKARQVDLYRRRIAAWLNSAFKQPGDIPCEVLKTLRARVTIMVGTGRQVAAFSIVAPSGNSKFDARVQATMASITGQQVPPPPPAYPEILNTSLQATLVGTDANCTSSSTPASPAPAPRPSDDEQQEPGEPEEPEEQPQEPSEPDSNPAPQDAPEPPSSDQP